MPRIKIKWMKHAKKAWGYAHTPPTRIPYTIRIDETADLATQLWTGLHEAQHVLHPEFHEDVVVKDSDTLKDVAWRILQRWKKQHGDYD